MNAYSPKDLGRHAEASNQATLLSNPKRMTRMCRHRAIRRNGFTLIELIVTIAVAAVLALILMSALSGIRQSAGRAQCIANLRQIGIGLQRYISEENGRLPPEPGLSLNAFLVDTMREMRPEILGNLGTSGILSVARGPVVKWWVCPSDPSKGGWARHGANNGIPKTFQDEAGINAHSYSLNMAIAFRRISEIPQPGKSILVVDFPWGALGTRAIWPGGATWTNALPGEWHNGNVNCLFMDGHVEPIRADTLALGKANAYLWYANYPSSGITPKTSY